MGGRGNTSSCGVFLNRGQEIGSRTYILFISSASREPGWRSASSDAICCAAAAGAQGSGETPVDGSVCSGGSVCEVTDSIYTADGCREKEEHDTQLQTHKREKERVK